MRIHGLLACALLVGCGGSPKKAPAPSPTPTGETPTAEPAVGQTPAPAQGKEKSLYDRLGGKEAITAVIDEFVARTTTDPRIKFRFMNVDAANLKKNLVDFVCVATGGPCKYEGRDMTTTHAGMDLADDEFTALVEDLVGALDKFKVPEKEKNEILGALGPLKPQIVAPADHFHPIEQAKLDKVTKLAATEKNKDAKEFLEAAVVAGKRGQRNYAEQLFSRAELLVGEKPLASVASVFRAGAPKRIDTPTTKMKDSGPQPKEVGSSDEDAPAKKPELGHLAGSITVDGKAPTGMGVVMLWPAKGGAHRTPKSRVIEQRGKEFAPHVMAVPVGSTIAFPNFDDIYHNVFSLSKSKAFDLGMYKSGETREVKFDKPGIVRLGCNIHANMSAYVIVVDAPHYVVAQPDGSFKFNSLAPGKYKVEAWSEQSSEPSKSELEIKAGDNTAKLDVKGGGGAGPAPDKFGGAR
jgi:hemoglobin